MPGRHDPNDISVRIDVSDVLNGLELFSSSSRSKVLSYMEKSANRLKEYMKSNAPWKDRTGNARRNLDANVEEEGDNIKIVLSHGVPYGVYLEYGMNLNFAILEPTVRLKGPIIIKGLEGILNK